jgi:hypothetical protein
MSGIHNTTLIVLPVLLLTVKAKLPPPEVTLNTIPSVLPISVVLLSAKTAPVELAVILTVPVR